MIKRDVTDAYYRLNQVSKKYILTFLWEGILYEF